MHKWGFYFSLFILSLLTFTSAIVPSVAAQGAEADLSDKDRRPKKRPDRTEHSGGWRERHDHIGGKADQ